MPTKLTRPTVVAGALVLLAFLFPGFTLHASGPWVPFVSQRLVKVYKVSGNSKHLISEKSEVWLRNSQGSTYLRSTPMIGVKPSAQWEMATLVDATTDTTYVIDYRNKTVRVEKGHPPTPRTPPTPDSFHSSMPKDRFIGRKTIDGIKCEGYRMLWAPGTARVDAGKPAGEAWVAPSLNFAALENTIQDRMAGQEIDIRVVSIQAGQEPDSALFKIPAGFRVLK